MLLDAGGVLMLPDPGAFRARLSPLGITPDDAICRRAHYLGVAEIDRIGRTDYGAADRAIAAVFGVPDGLVKDAIEAIELVYTHDPFVPVDGAAEQLRRLCGAGIRLGIVSNADGQIEAELDEHRICSRDGENCSVVEVVVDSHLAGVEKPDPAIFALALNALGLPAERCIYVGDSAYFDVRGAGAAGIPAVHVTPYNECEAGDHPHVPSLEDFVTGFLEK